MRTGHREHVSSKRQGRGELTAIAKMRKTHLQPKPSVIYPPAIGPMVGPRRGPMENIAIELPLCWAIKRSPIEPAPIVNGATPAQPAKKRKVRNRPMFGDSAHTMVHPRKARLQLMYISLLPDNSDSGAMILFACQ